MLYCRCCDKEIDFEDELDDKETEELANEMEEHKVVMLCMACWNLLVQEGYTDERDSGI